MDSKTLEYLSIVIENTVPLETALSPRLGQALRQDAGAANAGRNPETLGTLIPC